MRNHPFAKQRHPFEGVAHFSVESLRVKQSVNGYVTFGDQGAGGKTISASETQQQNRGMLRQQSVSEDKNLPNPLRRTMDIDRPMKGVVTKVACSLFLLDTRTVRTLASLSRLSHLSPGVDVQPLCCCCHYARFLYGEPFKKRESNRQIKKTSCALDTQRVSLSSSVSG